MTTEVSEGRVEARGVGFGLLEAGPAGGPLVLALHGFPDSARTWRFLMADLAEEGFRVVAPFTRGYAPTDVPPDGNYQLGALVADANALHEALGGDERAVLVGHDWGAMTAYGAATHAPERWSRVVASAVPPVATYSNYMFRYEQLKRSWYTWFFQTPFAEGIAAADDLAMLARLWSDWSPGFDAAEDMDHVRAALGAPANLAAAIGYYRALFDFASQDPELGGEQAAAMSARLEMPMLYIHGADDGVIGVESADETVLDIAGPGSRLLIVEKAGHFSHLEQPRLINDAILEFLTAGR